ncbi:hypothetical protein [Scytonema sp. NUACC26]|uniref:hypothetical protein n=1 Tax=Scytonema sp. NUACC26 TaxID=3140176 RepID=UPI0038B359B7
MAYRNSMPLIYTDSSIEEAEEAEKAEALAIASSPDALEVTRTELLVRLKPE